MPLDVTASEEILQLRLVLEAKLIQAAVEKATSKDIEDLRTWEKAFKENLPVVIAHWGEVLIITSIEKCMTLLECLGSGIFPGEVCGLGSSRELSGQHPNSLIHLLRTL